MNAGAAIGIICKAPRPGKSKTRLIPALGAEMAAQLSACFLRDISAAVGGLPAALDARGYGIFAPADGEAEIRALMPENFGFLFHGGGDFGLVLLNAARGLFSRGHDCVLLINSDSPTLPPALLTQAITALRAEGDRVVFGPATDGGYYLIGLKQAHARLFEDVPWSTEKVLEKSLERAADIALPALCLAPWYDVDDAGSLDTLRGEMAGRRPGFSAGGLRGGDAPATRALLTRIDARAVSGERADA